MDAVKIAAYLNALGRWQTKTGHKWVTTSCPLAPWTHQKGTDSSMGFGVTIDQGARSSYHCWACGNHGWLHELQQQCEHYTQGAGDKWGMDLKKAREVLETEEVEVVPLPEYSEFGTNLYKQFSEWPDWYKDMFPPAQLSSQAYDYLVARKVDLELQLKFDLRWDAKKRMIVCPFWNVDGKLAGMRGRSIDKSRHYDYTFNDVNNTGCTWYNEQVLQVGKPVVIVEGQFDCMHVSQAYPWVMAGLSSQVTEQKLRMLQFAPSVLFMRDNDESGRKSTARDAEYLMAKGIQVGVIEYPEHYKDPDMVPVEELKQLFVDLL